MLHEEIFREYFSLTRNAAWVALNTRDTSWTGRYRTTRVGKVQDGCFYFTIGETLHGKAHGLSRKLEQLIATHGLPALLLPSTHDQPRLFVGFDLRSCSASKLRAILEQGLRHIRTNA